MLRSQLAALAAIYVLSASVQAATISFNIDGDRLRTSGGALIPSGSLVLLIASSTNGSFTSPLVANGSNSTLLGSSGSFLSGDEIVLFRGASSNGFAQFSTGGIEQSLFPNWSLSDPLALVWFPTLTLASPTTLTAGTTYGFYTNASAIDGSNAWITPSAPASSVPLAFYTTDGNDLGPGTNPVSAANASQTVAAPEPTSALLLSVGLVSLASRRRRQVK